MKKGIVLWHKTVNKNNEILILFLAALIFCILTIWVSPRYISRINSIEILDPKTIYILIEGIMLFSFMATLYNVFGETIRNNNQLKYWMVLSEKEFYSYIFMKNIRWYYFFIIAMFFAGGDIFTGRIYVVILLTLLYIAVTCFIYAVQCALQYRGGIKTCAGLRKHTLRKNQYPFKSHPDTELIFLSWRYRYTSVERIICKTAVTAAGLFMLRWDLTGISLFIAYFVLVFILSFVDDNYWKREIADSAVLLRTSGVSFGKYFFVNMMSSILFHALLISLLYSLAAGSLLYGIGFLAAAVTFLCYWNLAYQYFYLSAGTGMEILKYLLFTVALVIEFVPIVNFIAVLYFWKKAYAIWGGYSVRGKGN